MPFKFPEDKKEYNQRYYQKNRNKLLAYRKLRREQDRENWREWYRRKKDEERKKKINLGQIYKPKLIYY